MALRDKYNHAVSTAKSLRMDGSADERDGKLYFHGTVNSEDEKNQIWNALKTVPDWQKEVVADIKVRPSKKFYGNANDYMEIFNANRDQLTDPDKITPGQVLKIPQHTHK